MLAPAPARAKFVTRKFVAKKLVLVALVVVEFVTVRLDRFAFVPKRFVAKKFVVVAEVPVAFRKVKFWRVDEAVEVKPTRVGFVLKTRDPDPVSSVTSAASFADVSIEVDDTLLLKSDQLDDERHPVVPAEAVSQVMEFTERVSPPEKVRAFSKSTPATAANTLPLELVLRREEVIEEIARAEEVARWKVAVLAVRVLAVAFIANELVDDAVVEKRFVVVPFVAVKFWRVEEPETNMFPELSIENLVVVANDAIEESWKSGVVPLFAPATSRRASGEVVPMPRLPPLAVFSAILEASILSCCEKPPVYIRGEGPLNLTELPPISMLELPAVPALNVPFTSSENVGPVIPIPTFPF